MARLVVGVALVALLAMSGVTTAATLAASAPFPATGTYKGATYAADSIVTRGLVCNVQNGSLACFDTQTDADAQAAAVTPLTDAVTALSSCSPPLQVWWDAQFQGSSIAFYDYPGWQDLPLSWRNQVSSWSSGCRAGRLSDYTGGGGNSIGLTEGSSSPIMPTGWDNRADAIYRY